MTETAIPLPPISAEGARETHEQIAQARLNLLGATKRLCDAYLRGGDLSLESARELCQAGFMLLTLTAGREAAKAYLQELAD